MTHPVAATGSSINDQRRTIRLPMKLTRPSRFVAALVAVLCMLFTQLAVAAYACPGAPGMPMAASEAMADMADCPEMEAQRSGLCQAHCDGSHPSLDKPGAPHVQPFVSGELSVVVQLPGIAAPTRAALIQPLLSARSSAPPLIIRNCCFRI